MPDQPPDGTVDQLLQTLGVKRIVVVDDEFAWPPPERLIGNLASGRVKTSDLPHVDSLKLADDAETNRALVRDAVALLTDAQRADLNHAFAKIVPKPADRGEKILRIGKVFKAFPPEFLSTSQWRARRSEFLDGTTPTLFLLDLRQTEDGGEATEGAKQVLEIESTKQPGYRIIISHKLNIEQEKRRHMELRGAHQIKLPFGAISKKRIDAEPESFTAELKQAIIEHHKEPLLVRARAIATKANSDAMERLEKMSNDEFEQIVFRSSINEGIWEPETILRWIQVHARQGFLEAAADDLELLAEARKVRATIFAISSKITAGTLTEMAKEFDELENFTSLKTLKVTRAPLANGDVFEIAEPGGQKTQHVLLAAPCDIAIRATGTRGDKNDKLRDVDLVPVVNKAALKNDFRATYCIPHYFGKDDGYLRLNRAQSTSTLPLDLCMYSEDGSAQLKLDQPKPPGLTEAYQRRYDAIHGAVSDWTQRLRKLDEKLAPEEVSALAAELGVFRPGHPSLSVTYSHGTIGYPLARIRRVNALRAHDCLLALLQHRGRLAFDAAMADAVPDSQDVVDQMRDKSQPAAVGPAKEGTTPSPPEKPGAETQTPLAN